MLNHYEAVFIVTPVLSDAQVKEAAEKFKAIIKSNGGEIVHAEDWGLRKLAYPIQKKSTGFYQLVQFDAPGELIQKLEVEFKRDEKVLRFLTFRLDKHAYAYSIKRKGNLKASKEDK